MALQQAKISDYMADNITTVGPDVEVLQAIDILLKSQISAAPVVDESGSMIGILSEKDCLKVALQAGFNESFGGFVKEFMSKDVTTLNQGDSIFYAAKLFVDTPFKRCPVVDDYHRLVGMVSRHDVLRAIENLI